MNLNSYPTWIRRIAILVIIAVWIALFITQWYPDPKQPNSILWIWWFSLLGTAILILLFGWGVTGRPSGAWINNQNQYSLTQVQLVTWTAIFVASLITAMLWNHVKGSTEPLKITIPGELWALLGISVGTTAGSALILTGKKNALPNPQEFVNNVYRAQQQGVKVTVSEMTLQDLENTDRNLQDTGVQGVTGTEVSLAGQVVQYDKPLIEAIFAGDEVGDFHFLDIGKVQMFFFTLLVVLAYSASVISSFFAEAIDPKTSGLINAFPLIDQSLIVLIAISHAGYLAYQSVSKSAAADAQVHPLISRRGGVRGLGREEAQQISDEINEMRLSMRGVHSLLQEIGGRLYAMEERWPLNLQSIESRLDTMGDRLSPRQDPDKTKSAINLP